MTCRSPDPHEAGGHASHLFGTDLPITAPVHAQVAASVNRSRLHVVAPAHGAEPMLREMLNRMESLSRFVQEHCFLPITTHETVGGEPLPCIEYAC